VLVKEHKYWFKVGNFVFKQDTNKGYLIL